MTIAEIIAKLRLDADDVEGSLSCTPDNLRDQAWYGAHQKDIECWRAAADELERRTADGDTA